MSYHHPIINVLMSGTSDGSSNNFALRIWTLNSTIELIFSFQSDLQVPLQYYQLRIQLPSWKQLCATSDQFSRRNPILSLLSMSAGNARRRHNRWFQPTVESPQYSRHRTFPVFALSMGFSAAFWYFPAHVCQSSIVSWTHSSSSVCICRTISRSNTGWLLDPPVASSIQPSTCSQDQLYGTTVCTTKIQHLFIYSFLSFIF